jgi:hypothetical protein
VSSLNLVVWRSTQTKSGLTAHGCLHADKPTEEASARLLPCKTADAAALHSTEEGACCDQIATRGWIVNGVTQNVARGPSNEGLGL